MKKLSLFLAILFLINHANAIEKLIEVPEIEVNDKKEQKDSKPVVKEIREDQKEETKDATKKVRDPFKAVLTPKESQQVSNQPLLNLFTSSEIKLPSTARKIKKITIEYQNLNGSISALEQELHGDIDWHFPLILSQEIKNLDNEISREQKFSLGNQFMIATSIESLNIKTNHKLLRDFTLASPTRLVLDFENPNKKPLEDNYDTKIPLFTQFILQSYLDFYRIIIVLDGQYDYSIKENKEKNVRFFNIDFK